MENCTFACFRVSRGWRGWIAARRRREATTGWTGPRGRGVLASLRKLTGSQASRLSRTDGLTLTPSAHCSRPWGILVTASGTPEPMACRSKTPRPSESGKPLCHGAAGARWRIADPFRAGAGSMSPAWTRVTLLLRAPASRTIHRDQGVQSKLELRVSSLDIFNDDPMMSRTKSNQSKRQSMYWRWKGGHSRMHPLGEGAG